MNEFEQEFDHRPEEWDVAVLRVATYLQTQGVESALIEVSISSAQIGADKETLMDEAVSYLLESDNPAQNFAALEYLKHKAESTPDALRAKSLSASAYDDSLRHVNLEIIQRKFEVALMNARGSFAQEGMTGAYVMILDEMLERIKASEIDDEMYRKAVAEFSVPVMGFAQHHSQNATISNHVRMALNGTLAKISSVMGNANDQEALRAYSLIDENSGWKVMAGDNLRDRHFHHLLMSRNFEEAAKQLDTFNDNFPRDIWEKAARLIMEDPKQRSWGDEIIDFLKMHNRYYFVETSWNRYDPDGRFGTHAGKVIGLLGRTDIIEQVFPDGVEMVGGKETAVGVAYGLGWSQQGHVFTRLWNKLHHFGINDRADVSEAYMRAAKEKAEQGFRDS